MREPPRGPVAEPSLGRPGPAAPAAGALPPEPPLRRAPAPLGPRPSPLIASRAAPEPARPAPAQPGLPGKGRARAGTPQTDTARPGIARPGTDQPETARADAAKADTAQTETSRAGTAAPEADPADAGAAKAPARRGFLRRKAAAAPRQAEPAPLPAKAPLPTKAPEAPMAGAAPRRSHGVRRDPAPSRAAYRMQRLWLTPVFRGCARIGLPLMLIAAAAGIWLGDSERRAALVTRYETLVRDFQERPEFMVSLLKIEGASPEVDAAIRALMPVALPASSFRIDLGALHGLITRLDAVREASLVFRQGGTLEVKVTERVPAILWRHAAGVEMLDEEGHRVATLLDRTARPDLPLVAGEGAERAIPEALAILAAAGPVLPRARGLVRIGERRWDIVLDRGQRILLPEAAPVRALEGLLAIDAAEDLLARDFTRLDLRNEARPTLRLSAAAHEEFRRLKGFEVKVSQ